MVATRTRCWVWGLGRIGKVENSVSPENAENETLRNNVKCMI